MHQNLVGNPSKKPSAPWSEACGLTRRLFPDRCERAARDICPGISRGPSASVIKRAWSAETYPSTSGLRVNLSPSRSKKLFRRFSFEGSRVTPAADSNAHRCPHLFPGRSRRGGQHPVHFCSSGCGHVFGSRSPKSSLRYAGNPVRAQLGDSLATQRKPAYTLDVSCVACAFAFSQLLRTVS